MRNTCFEDSVDEENRITQDTIDNLNRPVFSTIDDTVVTDYIWELCKKLLVYAKERYESKELAYAINLSTLDFIGSVFGDSRTVDITPLIRLMNNHNHVFIVIHNHPSNSPFSPKDLETFFSTASIMILVVLGNKGSIYIAEKSASISGDDYRGIKKLIIKYRQGDITFSEVMTKLTDYNVVFSDF